MKLFQKLLIPSALLLAATSAAAQVPLVTPMESQFSQIMQRIDFTDITVSYSSPGVKGRKIFGNIVPFGKVWRAGANDNTVIRFSSDVAINGNLLKAGAYGLHVIPTETEWTFIFSSKTGDWGSYNYNPSYDVLRVNVPVEKAPFTEWMQFNFTERAVHKGRLELQWEASKAGFDIAVDPSLIVANFTDQLRNRQGFGYLAWMQAASYCLGKNIQLEQAVAWADSSIKREKRFDNLYLKARILAKMGKNDEREHLINEALTLAKDADYYRVTDDLLKEGNKALALKTAQLGLKAFPAAWMTLTAAGRAQAENGDVKSAKKSFDAALKAAPENRKKMVQEFADKVK
jgi:tetratricopeptide (TPR) repeat protein